MRVPPSGRLEHRPGQAADKHETAALLDHMTLRRQASAPAANASPSHLRPPLSAEPHRRTTRPSPISTDIRPIRKDLDPPSAAQGTQKPPGPWDVDERHIVRHPKIVEGQLGGMAALQVGAGGRHSELAEVADGGRWAGHGRRVTRAKESSRDRPAPGGNRAAVHPSHQGKNERRTVPLTLWSGFRRTIFRYSAPLSGDARLRGSTVGCVDDPSQAGWRAATMAALRNLRDGRLWRSSPLCSTGTPPWLDLGGFSASGFRML